MADRNGRYQRGDYQSQHDETGYRRQSEQFESAPPRQSGDYDTMEGDYSTGGASGREWDTRFQPSRQETRGYSWRDRSTGQSSTYDPLQQYEQPSHGWSERQGARQPGTHGTFRGDDFGSGAMAGYADRSASARGYSDYGSGDRAGGSSDRGFLARAGDEVAKWFGDGEAAQRRQMDHRGRGPSNYSRSDERILEDACDRLTDDYAIDATNVTVSVSEGEITLNGTVASRDEKRRAEDCVHEVSGVNHVQNNLRVKQETYSSGGSTDTTSGSLS